MEEEKRERNLEIVKNIEICFLIDKFQRFLWKCFEIIVGD